MHNCMYSFISVGTGVCVCVCVATLLTKGYDERCCQGESKHQGKDDQVPCILHTIHKVIAGSLKDIVHRSYYWLLGPACIVYIGSDNVKCQDLVTRGNG